MSSDTALASIPVSWLRPLPRDYEIPVWRWILLPASAFMLRRNKGVWVSGTLQLTASELRFTQSKGIGRAQPASWSIPLAEITAAPVRKGMASETLEIAYKGETVQIMTVRADDFIARLHAAIAQ